jgi:outer membrane protein insertion porin family
MIAERPLLYNNLLKAITAGFLIAVFVSSCTVVKNYQPDQPFVFKTNINLIGNFSNQERKELESGLRDQLDDSVQARRVNSIVRSVLKNPPVYNPANADKSIIFMKALLKAQGYFNDSIGYSHSIDTVKKSEYRTTINFYVKPGKQTHFDTVIYSIEHPELQYLADSAKKDAFVKKGSPFAKALVSAELDRLTELFRNKGYLLFARDELVGLWDTLNADFLKPTFDPFEQIEALQRLSEQKKDPTATLEIKLKNPDSSRLKKYYVGNITVIPDYGLDTVGYPRQRTVIDSITITQYHQLFKPKIFPPNIYFKRGSLYSQQRYLRTLNRFNSFGTWRTAGIEQKARPGTDSVDFEINLNPAKKYSFNTNLESSINQSIISGNLLGIGLNVGWQNRNFLKSANITSTNVRYGVELGNNGGEQFIQSQQLSLSYNIYFPRPIVPGLKLIPERLRDNLRTLFSFNAARTERRFLYELATINGAWGYEFQRSRKRSVLISAKLPNIEFSSLNKKDSLNKLIIQNPSLNTIFTDGLVVSLIGNLTIASPVTARHVSVFRTNVELAPFVAGWFRSKFLDSQIYRYIKIDAEFARLYRFEKTSVALRIFGGVGFADPFDNTRNPNKRNNLPFFKEYFSGGPNSMRAWALRRLGPGSTIKEFNGPGSIPDRFGDVQIEANAEYRFPIARPFGIALNGAVFTDVGNVWFLKDAPGRPAEEVFSFNRLGKDLAIGSGVGLRVDFGFFVLRLDYAYKVKDPSPAPVNQHLQNKWFGYRFFDGDQFQLGINYPFIF